MLSRKKYVVTCCWIFVFVLLVWCYVPRNKWRTQWKMWRNRGNNRECSTKEHIKQLNYREVPYGDSVFFIISSDIYDNVTIAISGRQACSIESAAYFHPEKDIFVLLVVPEEFSTLCHSYNPILPNLLAYPNVKLRLVHANRFLEQTPARVLLDPLANSQYPVEHTSDILRYAVLYKFGGLYLDTDVILLRRMPHFSNYAGAESFKWVGAGIINFGMDKVGRDIADKSMEQLIRTFTGQEYSTSGPKVISEVLFKRCNPQRDLTNQTADCGGFHITPSYMFYGVPFSNYAIYFSKGQTYTVLKMLENSTTIHYWNHVTAQMKANEAGIPFFDIAEHHCPRVFLNARDKF